MGFVSHKNVHRTKIIIMIRMPHAVEKGEMNMMFVIIHTGNKKKSATVLPCTISAFKM